MQPKKFGRCMFAFIALANAFLVVMYEVFFLYKQTKLDFNWMIETIRIKTEPWVQYQVPCALYKYAGLRPSFCLSVKSKQSGIKLHDYCFGTFVFSLKIWLHVSCTIFAFELKEVVHIVSIHRDGTNVFPRNKPFDLCCSFASNLLWERHTTNI